ncbi:hypothetical protein MASR2M48_19410 [Spirochaetota bacterium]
MLIFLADAFTSDLPKRLEAFGQVTQDQASASEAEIIIVRSKTKVGKDMIDASPKLKFVIRGGVGVDTIDVPYAESKGITVVNTPEASSVAVAELAFAMMAAMPANIVAADVSMKQGKWLKKELERTELMGKTLGLIGIGRIARELAVRAKAFGMHVVAYDKYVDKSDAAEMMSLDKVYAQADFISIHTPDRRDPRHDKRRSHSQDEEGRTHHKHLPRSGGSRSRRSSGSQERPAGRIRYRRLRQRATGGITARGHSKYPDDTTYWSVYRREPPPPR